MLMPALCYVMQLWVYDYILLAELIQFLRFSVIEFCYLGTMLQDCAFSVCTQHAFPT